MRELLEAYFDRLYPIPRSLTGDGVRQTLKILGEIIDLRLVEVPSGTRALDWTVPLEWNVREAYIITPEGKKIGDFRTNNLHLIGYSTPVDQSMTYEELRSHIITRPDLPDAIPYATSYYQERWGFCLAHREFEQLPREGTYHVRIDSRLAPGFMTYGEAILKGDTDYEILFTSYICHPSMANNELSGPLAAAFLYRELTKIPNRKYTYRFLLGPETIGAIYYLSILGDHFRAKLEAGLVLTCCGDAGNFTFKKSRPDSYLNRLIAHLLHHRTGENHSIREFFPMGSDERQYGSPGFNLPVGCLCRSMYGTYPEYHTSMDDKSVLSFNALEETVLLLRDVITAIELEAQYLNLAPYGEPQLGRRGLYPTLMSDLDRENSLERILYLLNFSDGKHSLLDIAQKMDEPAVNFASEINDLLSAGLLSKKFHRLT